MKIDESKFKLEDFEKSKTKKWTLGNNVLYKMCSDHLLHTDPEEIRAKIWLIGRSYAAAIERREKKMQINDDFYDYVINEFVKFNNKFDFDSKLKLLKNKEFNEESLKDILLIHENLTNFFKELTGKEKRSLASKYLHFHVTIFPIYDSRAKDSINKFVIGKVLTLNGDKDYSAFCQKILLVYNFIHEKTGKRPSLREIDTFLVYIANNKLNRNKNNK